MNGKSRIQKRYDMIFTYMEVSYMNHSLKAGGEDMEKQLRENVCMVLKPSPND